MERTLDRRTFVAGAALATTALCAASAAAHASESEAAPAAGATFADTVAWDGEYDVVVVGFGAAGAVSAVSAADAGATVLLVDKAPEGHEGGNSRYCGQLFIYGHEDEEATKAYYTAMAGDLPIPEDVLDVYTKGIAHSMDMFSELLGLDKEEFVLVTPDAFPTISMYSPEYPEFEGSDKINMGLLHNGASDAYMWQAERQAVVDRKDMIDVWFESPATRLVQDPQSKTVVGVEISRGGETVRIHALNGVVMTCGGFENNPQMVADHLGIGHSAPLGTLYNTGDGHKMVQEVGADLWHMHAYEAMWLFGGLAYMTAEGERATMVDAAAGFNTGSIVLVGTDGYRYLREDEVPRHGHVYRNGTWESPKHPSRCFLVWDQAKMDELAATGRIGEDVQVQIVSAPNLTELAAAIGTKEGVLEQTVADFDAAAASGHDPALNRAAESMRAFDDGPFYALECMPCILNTQGGPRRSAAAEVVGVDGNPIPHLYSAGEFGGVTSNMYQGGGNMTECVIFGRIAGENAAAPKDPLPAYEVAPVASNLVYTPGSTTDLVEKSYEAGAGEYIGTGMGIGGEIVVKVATDGTTIDSIEVLEQKETAEIGGAALEQLPNMVIEAQTTEIDAIAGATKTSNAFFAAVEEAMAQAV